MAKVVASMCYVKCNFKKFASPEGFLYETLSKGLGNFLSLFFLANKKTCLAQNRSTPMCEALRIALLRR